MRKIVAHGVLALFAAVHSGKPSILAADDAAPAPAVKQALLPIPDAAAQQKAEKLVRQLFTEDYAKRSPEGQRTLAGKLLQSSGQSTGDSTALYVLLRDARDLAASASDIDTAMASVDAMGRTFAINPIDMKLAVLATAERAQPAPAGAGPVRTCLGLSGAAIELGNFSAAVRFATYGESAARRAKDPALVSECQAAVSGARRIEAANTILLKNPQDKAANSTVGSFLCFTRGDWTKGLPMLLAGSDPSLASLATRELKDPKDADTQFDLANGWWDLAQKQPVSIRPRIEGHAGEWYRRALPGLKSLSLAVAQKRAAAAPASDGSEPPLHQAPSVTAPPAIVSVKPKTVGISKQMEAFAKERSDLPPEKQLDATVAKLKELNGGAEIKVVLKTIADGETDLRLTPQAVVVNIEPLYGMKVRTLNLYACSKLKSLNGVQGMALSELSLRYCEAIEGDLSILRGMPLTKLDLFGCKGLTSLNGIQGMALTELDLTYCEQLRGDLLVLKGMPLTKLKLGGCRSLRSLDGLGGAPLKELELPRSFSQMDARTILRTWPTLETVRTGDKKLDEELSAAIKKKKA